MLFRSDCARGVLQGVCPNCGGGLYPRPVRPQAKLATRPAATERKHKPVDPEKHAAFAAAIRDVPAHLR